MDCCICHASAAGPRTLFGYCNPAGVAIMPAPALVLFGTRLNEYRFCGQGCALVAVERYLDRGTFEPAPETVLALPVDDFAELT